jgi:hypothetical protein
MNIVIGVSMGWDKKLQCPTPSGELFNFCKRFLTSTKFQGFGNLHAHWLVYTIICQPLPLGFYNLLEIQTPRL